MSTRGVIARKDGDGFTGRYHHLDSYPSGLGQTLYRLAQQMPRGTPHGRGESWRPSGGGLILYILLLS